jgi:hypothetical protein
MMFQEAKDRAKASQDHAKTSTDQAKSANKVALEAEKKNDSVQKEVQELQRVLEQKRSRTHAVTVHDDEDCDQQSSDDWDLADYRRETVHIQNHLSVVLASHEDVPTPQKSPAGSVGSFSYGECGMDKALPMSKTGTWGCVQARERWSLKRCTW